MEVYMALKSNKLRTFLSLLGVTIGTEEENSRFLNSLADCLGELAYV